MGTEHQKCEGEHIVLTVVSIRTCLLHATLKFAWLKKSRHLQKHLHLKNQKRRRCPKRSLNAKSSKWTEVKEPCNVEILRCVILRLVKRLINNKNEYVFVNDF